MTGSTHQQEDKQELGFDKRKNWQLHPVLRIGWQKHHQTSAQRDFYEEESQHVRTMGLLAIFCFKDMASFFAMGVICGTLFHLIGIRNLQGYQQDLFALPGMIPSRTRQHFTTIMGIAGRMYNYKWIRAPFWHRHPPSIILR